MDKTQEIQSTQYEFPYHFLPQFDEQDVRLVRQWNWAPSYLAALQIMKVWFRNNVAMNKPWHHGDVGCGDGALLYHLNRHFSNAESLAWSGVDYDENAIRWARMFGGDKISFYAQSVADLPGEAFDSASLIEVAEHIPPDQLKDFVRAIKGVMKPGATLLVTVPHSNRGVQKKHYQHFSFASLRAAFEPEFECISIGGFGKHSRVSRLVQRAIINRKYVFTLQAPTRYVVNTLAQVHPDEAGVARIFAEFRKP